MPDHERPPAGSDFHRFARLVCLMRAHQSEYFRTRSPSMLAQARDLERRVDVAVAWALETTQPAPLLPGLAVPDEEEDGLPPGAYRAVTPTGRRVPLRRRKL
jgi:hypothetical protein